MNRITTSALNILRLLPRAALILMLLAAPVLAVPMMRADDDRGPLAAEVGRRLRVAGLPAARLKHVDTQARPRLT